MDFKSLFINYASPNEHIWTTEFDETIISTQVQVAVTQNVVFFKHHQNIFYTSEVQINAIIKRQKWSQVLHRGNT